MNYRHAFHAGNHADVLKHVLLTRVLDYMRQKDKPFAVLDTHAGAGVYDLAGTEAFKTGEWHGGIERLLSTPMPDDLAPLFSDFRDVIAKLNRDGTLRRYPGSPEIAHRMLRRDDRLILNELHPEEAGKLKAHFLADPQVKITVLDAGQSVKAELPFRERRGLVLIDPAFEMRDEAERVLRIVKQILQRMAATVVMVWYPIKSEDDAKTFREAFAAFPANGILATELRVREPFKEGGLAGSGMVIINPPHTLHAEAQRILPFLGRVLGTGKWGRGSVNWLSPPR
ncbi:MAG: 23S rRNA (adenine(2030)-N(6))-methyltransferase RlmJ [Proteobacteria bacterium]|nr:23S rRNA (adenine(2030)-N(6))-methyltransferase RlmJ [Pseudomonadota bacterium]